MPLVPYLAEIHVVEDLPRQKSHVRLGKRLESSVVPAFPRQEKGLMFDRSMVEAEIGLERDQG